MHELNEVPKYSQLESINPGFKVLLWDLDGTIIDTEFLHVASTKIVLENHTPDHHLSPEQLTRDIIGFTDHQIFERMQKHSLLLELDIANFLIAKNTVFTTLLSKTDPSDLCINQIRELMAEAKQNGIKQMIVTSCEKPIVDILVRFLKIEKFFEKILTREDTTENKPSPMPYNEAIKYLGADPRQVIILEDSFTGLTAAKATQATTCKVTWYPLIQE